MAGQAVYYVAQTVFFTHRSVFLLTVNLTRWCQATAYQTAGARARPIPGAAGARRCACASPEDHALRSPSRVVAWAELLHVQARHSDSSSTARVVLVGTHCDGLSQAEVERRMQRLVALIDGWVDSVRRELEAVRLSYLASATTLAPLYHDQDGGDDGVTHLPSSVNASLRALEVAGEAGMLAARWWGW